MPSKIRFRRATAANWTSANPVLALGEVGLETDTRYLKFGDGTATWTSLPYFNHPDLVSATADVVANVIAKRDASGNLNAWRFFVSSTSPTSAGELTRKDYVDGVRRVPRGYNTTNRTFVLGDEGMHHDFDCAGTTALTGTIPADATANFPVGSWISVGVMNPTASLYLTIAPATGVTLRSAFGTGAVTLRTGYDVIRVRKVAADIWQVDGAVTSSAGVANAVVRRDGSGNVEINSVAISAAATQTFHATRKDYVDALGTDSVTANSVARRNADGSTSFQEVYVAAQTLASSATRKDYVDTKVANVAGVARAEKLTQAAYDAITTKVADTLYVIVG